MNYTDLSRKTYSMACHWCAARYLRDGGQSIESWSRYGIDPNEVNELRQHGEFIDPSLKRRK